MRATGASQREIASELGITQPAVSQRLKTGIAVVLQTQIDAAADDRSPRHASAVALLARLAAGPGLVYLFWPVAMACLRIAMHTNVFDRPLDPAEARQNPNQLVGRLTCGALERPAGSGGGTKTSSALTRSAATW